MALGKRIESVDIFRGMTIVLMILVNNPGSWSDVYAPFLHAHWHGYTPTDLVFPFFLFIVGTSIVFAYQHKKPEASTYKKITVRSLKLIGLGIFLGAFTLTFPFFKPFDHIRFPGVLQRIGAVFFFASLLFLHLDRKTLIGICAAVLIGYWIWMGFVPIQGVSPTLERAANNWANFVDLHVFGTHMWKEDYDPEGLLSTLPAICSSLMGIFTGLLIRSERPDKVRTMALLGSALLVVGHLWDFVFPINKALWTSSFVLVTAGWANLVLALIFYLTDVKGIAFGGLFKKVGSNAITVYFLSSFCAKLMGLIKIGDTSVKGWIFQHLYVHDFMTMKLSSLLFALSYVALFCLLARWMYKRGIFIKV